LAQPTADTWCDAERVTDFDTFRDQLTEAGFQVSAEDHHPESFGSWLLDLDTQPRCRLIWDGKDHWLILQRGGVDEWIAKSRDEQTPEAVIAQLRGHS